VIVLIKKDGESLSAAQAQRRQAAGLPSSVVQAGNVIRGRRDCQLWVDRVGLSQRGRPISAARTCESRAWLETWWSNYYLRGSVIFDETGSVSRNYYRQPDADLRFGRGFIIDADQSVAPPMFGYDAQRAIDKIYELLADLDGDGDVDLNDLAALLAVYGTGSE